MNATVQYSPDQIDDEGRPVSTAPFTVEFEQEPGQSAIDAIAETGDVQFDWTIVGWIEEGEIFAESQGAFAPETLAPSTTNDVWSRRFLSAEHIIDVSAAPTIPQDALYSEGFDYSTYDGGYEVTVITETRDAGDDDGDTSNYEYEDLHDHLVSYAAARASAEAYVRHLDPERAFS